MYNRPSMGTSRNISNISNLPRLDSYLCKRKAWISARKATGSRTSTATSISRETVMIPLR